MQWLVLGGNAIERVVSCRYLRLALRLAKFRRERRPVHALLELIERNFLHRERAMVQSRHALGKRMDQSDHC